MVEPSNAEQADWPDATRAYVRDLTLHFDNCERLAERLMVMAAKRSTETSFGWTHPDCETLQAAASTLRDAPEHQTDPMPIGVLSGIEPSGQSSSAFGTRTPNNSMSNEGGAVDVRDMREQYATARDRAGRHTIRTRIR